MPLHLVQLACIPATVTQGQLIPDKLTLSQSGYALVLHAAKLVWPFMLGTSLGGGPVRAAYCMAFAVPANTRQIPSAEYLLGTYTR